MTVAAVSLLGISFAVGIVVLAVLIFAFVRLGKSAVDTADYEWGGPESLDE